MCYVCTMETRLSIAKERVYDEVDKTTAYAGAKMAGGDGAYDRIFTTEEDRELLERFWQEACATCDGALKPFLKHAGEREGDYVRLLELPASYPQQLTPSVEDDLSASLTLYIAGKWFAVAAGQEAEACLADAAVRLDAAMRKLYYRKAPERPGGCCCRSGKEACI